MRELTLRNIVPDDPVMPVPPLGLPYLLSVLGDDDIDVKALAAGMERFPSIAARLITLANSVWVAPPSPVTSLSNACALLGLRLVSSVSIALAVARPFNSSRCPGFDSGRLWCTAFLAAEGAALLAPYLGPENDRDTLRTAGVLHNLGLLWMADTRPAPTSMAIQAVVHSADGNLIQTLRATTGTDYCEVGGLLGEAWHLPQALTVVMRHHRNGNYRGAHWRAAAGCGVAAAMASALWRGMDSPPGEITAWPLDIPLSEMAAVFGQLARKYESMRELVQTLFGR